MFFNHDGFVKSPFLHHSRAGMIKKWQNGVFTRPFIMNTTKNKNWRNVFFCPICKDSFFSKKSINSNRIMSYIEDIAFPAKTEMSLFYVIHEFKKLNCPVRLSKKLNFLVRGQ
jgi:hypothetical protein